MGDLTIRGIDENVSELFAAEARREGKSPEELAREIITLHVDRARSALANRLDEIRRSTHGKVTVDPVDLIRSDRDHDHRY